MRINQKHRDILVCLYIAFVLIIDSLNEALHFVKGMDFRGFNLFTFLVWFVVPFWMTFRQSPWKFFSWRGLKKYDWVLLAAVVVVGFFSYFLIPKMASLHSVYGATIRPEMRVEFAIRANLWVLSWLPGWELMHRFLLLQVSERLFGYRRGWWLVPAYEVIFHFQKPLIEAFGMLIFSILITYQTRNRRNGFIGLISHLCLELELIAFQLYS